MTQAKKATAAQAKEETAAQVKPVTAVEVKSEAAPKEKAERVENIFLQAGGREWNIAQLRDQAVAAYAAEGHRVSGIKRLELYVKPEDGKAYFVINEKFEGSVNL